MPGGGWDAAVLGTVGREGLVQWYLSRLMVLRKWAMWLSGGRVLLAEGSPAA